MISVRKLTKSFAAKAGSVSVLSAVDLEVEDGRFVVLLGPSGSGKTTLLRCVAGLEMPDDGEIRIGAEPVFSRDRGVAVPAEQRRLGMVFQSYAIWPHLTVYDNVALPLRHGVQRIAAPLVRSRVLEALAAVRLDHLADRPAPLLSGGQQQRVALARALAVQPRALLMDEPLSNLDARLREDIRVEIRALVRDIGITVLYVTHDRTEAMALADRVCVMEDGRIVQTGEPSRLYARPATAQVAELFGSINWIAGEIRCAGRIETAIGQIATSSEAAPGRVRAGIRPEDVVLSTTPGDGGFLAGRLTELTSFGDHFLCAIRIGEERLIARTSAAEAATLGGKDVYVSLPRDKVHVFAAGDP
jgi:iron(III) transport system ATP-binding protein